MIGTSPERSIDRFSISDIYVSMLSIDPTRASFSQYNAPASMMAAVSNILLTSVDEELLDTFFTEWDKDFAPTAALIMKISKKASARTAEPEIHQCYKQLDSFYKAFDFKSDFRILEVCRRNGDGNSTNKTNRMTSKLQKKNLPHPNNNASSCWSRLIICATSCRRSAYGKPTSGPSTPFPTIYAFPDSEVYEIWTAAYATIRQCNYMIHILTSKTYDYDVKPYVGLPIPFSR